VAASIPYGQLYQLKFSQPATYIRFSSTVEDCCGCPYNMTDEDDVFLKELNERPSSKKTNPAHCSEDTFEEVMYFFELTAKNAQPFSSVGDAPPVLSLEEMLASFDENIDELPRSFVPDVYEHWHARRSQEGNTAIQPGLKLKVIETTNDTDDNDPYVCFRRREVRQVRKTRGRDAQSVEKLKKLRKELEDARQLVALVRQREVLKKESLTIDRHLFEQRSNLRSLKKSLPDQYRDGDEDLLINQKVYTQNSNNQTPVLTSVAAQEEACGHRYIPKTYGTLSPTTGKPARRPAWFRGRSGATGRSHRREGERDRARD
jgi:enhancer of polycomb-like protein